MGKFGADIAGLLGFVGNKWIEFLIGDKQPKVSPFHSSIRGGLTTLYVYCDFIESTMIGGELRYPLLRIINWEAHSERATTAIQFVRPYYCKIKKNNFDSARIQIMDETGNEVKFLFGKCVIVLEFRKKDKN